MGIRPLHATCVALTVVAAILAVATLRHGAEAEAGNPGGGPGLQSAQAATREIALVRGWNLVGWSDAAPVADAVAPIRDAVDAVFAFDAAAGAFRRYAPAGPGVLNTLETLPEAGGFWVLANRAVTWEAPALAAEAPSLSLAAGFNLVTWLGADDTPVADTIGSLDVDLVAVWDAERATFRSYRPAAPAALNSLSMLRRGDAVWIRASRPMNWNQRGAAPAATSPLASVRSWAYQLQGNGGGDLDLAVADATGADLLVVEPSRDGSEAGVFRAAEVATAQAGGTLVIGYISIGEAESYRDYWDPAWVADGEPTAEAPVWLGPANPDYPDNYKVRYWDPEWQELVLARIDRLIDAGFNGVYLDIIDAYEFWEELPAAGPPPQGMLMAEFVQVIALHARGTRDADDFIVIPQNGAAILNALTTSQQQAYLAAIDGIGVEDTFYFGDASEDNPLNPQEDTLGWIRQFQVAGKTVLAVDYLTDPAKQADFVARAEAEGFLPLVARRALDGAIPQPGRAPQNP